MSSSSLTSLNSSSSSSMASSTGVQGPPKWHQLDVSEILTTKTLQTHYKSLGDKTGQFFKTNRAPPSTYTFPDFGAHELQPAAIKNICEKLRECITCSVVPLQDMPSVMVYEAMAVVWENVMSSMSSQLTPSNIKRLVAFMKEEIKSESQEDVTELNVKEKPTEKMTGNEVLIEAGVKTGLNVVFALLRQAWSQLAWQKQIEQALSAGGSLVPLTGLPPPISLPNEILKSILDILNNLPPLSLSNSKLISKLGTSCLEQAAEFLEWVLKPDSHVDHNGKRLACEITLSLAIQCGSLVRMAEWISKMLLCLEVYSSLPEDVPRPTLSMEFCHKVLEEIAVRTRIGISFDGSDSTPKSEFKPDSLSPEGSVNLIDFVLHLAKELSETCDRCTAYFRDQSGSDNGVKEDRFLSETCDVYAFGSNSSSQLAMGSTEKFVKGTIMPHMANIQVIHAGQYCSFLIFADGSVKACGKGSYGRLGLGNSENQSQLKAVNTFPDNVTVRRITSSKGSDGHSMAITSDGKVFSWGDGNYGKLGHGDAATQKSPKRIEALAGKFVVAVACGNRHSAAVTQDGELYTWGEAENGRIGHGTAPSTKVPTKVTSIGLVKDVACGVAHTLALSMDGQTVWSFGSGDSGKLGHGDTVKQTTPKAIDALRGMTCQKVCAGSQFSLVLTTGGKVYSFGNGSGVGKGTTEPRQYTPWLIEALDGEMIIDICTGDGHCLALTQRGEVFAWGTNSMGQCGQGHNNGSITTPAKVKGLDGIQIQQISAGTSHSIAWTAMPMNRRASAMWHWPYCVSVNEATFKNLIQLLLKYGDLSTDATIKPFSHRDSQVEFLHSVLSLVRTHVGLVAPLGPSCVRMACGRQVKPLRDLLFKFIDSQLPPSLDKVTGEALEVGSSVLLPPVADRISLLLSILPDDPAKLTTLSTGQRHHLNVMLEGFASRQEFIVLVCDDGDQPSIYCESLYTLCQKMVSYLHYSLSSTMNGTPLLPDLEMGSKLMKHFESFIISVMIVSMSWMEKQVAEKLASDSLHQLAPDILLQQIAEKYFSLFYETLKGHSRSVLCELATIAENSGDPVTYLQGKKDILFGFLCYEFPIHFCLSSLNENIMLCTTDSEPFQFSDFLLNMANCVHGLVGLLPGSLVEECEKRELLSEPVKSMHSSASEHEDLDLQKLRNGASENEMWIKLIDYERLFTRAAAQHTKCTYTSQCMEDGQYGVIDPSTPPTVKNSHFLCNGLVGSQHKVAEEFVHWISLCKHLPGAVERLSKAYTTDKQPDSLPPNMHQQEDFYNDYITITEVFKKRTNVEHFSATVESIQPADQSTLSPLLALATGCMENQKAAELYDKMMEVAKWKDWNTYSDEEVVPQLKQVSCAALACLLNHTGLYKYALDCTARPKKKLIDVYRAVFSIRREVFNQRPVPDSKGDVSKDKETKFQSSCNAICVDMLFLILLVDAAMPEENEPIVPQIATTHSAVISPHNVSRASPEISVERSKAPPVRLSSHPALQDTTDGLEAPHPVTVEHSTSVSPFGSTQEDSGWSLPAVKQALSHLRWQRDRLHFHTSSSPHGPDSTLAKTCSVVVDCAVEIFKKDNTSSDSSFRVELVQAMLLHQQRALSRVAVLKRIMRFLDNSENPQYLLDSSKLLFLSGCLNHDIHYSAGISVAPSVLQHEVKNLSNSLTGKMLKSFSNLSDPFSQRGLLLALQWSSFDYQPGDLLYLLSQDQDLYSKVVSLSGVVSSRLPEVPLSHSRLASRVRLGCVLMSQLLCMEVGVKSEVLKSIKDNDSLELVSSHLFGQLEGYVNNHDLAIAKRWENMECSDEEREGLLGAFLKFVNTLSATNEAMREELASDKWFQVLLRIVDVDSDTGKPAIASLKTRLLALQALGAIMADLTDNSPDSQAKCAMIVDELLELMARFMFLAPLTKFQDAVKAPVVEEEVPPLPPRRSSRPPPIPFRADPVNQQAVTVTAEEENMCVQSTGSIGYVMGLSALNAKHTWTVKAISDNPSFCVGVGQKPLTDRATNTSDQFWLYEAQTGRMLHNGETGDLLPSLSSGESVTLTFDKEEKSLSITKVDANDTGPTKEFTNVYKPGADLFPVIVFNRSHSRTNVSIEPFVTGVSVSSESSKKATINIKTDDSSGYPVLSPTSTTLVSAVVNMLYQLQNKDPWKKAITNVLTRRLSETDNIVHRLLDFKMEIRASGGDHITPLSRLISQFTKVVWPCLAVVGGVDSGFCLGKKCQIRNKDESGHCMIVSTPDSDSGDIEVQAQVTAGTTSIKRKSLKVSELKLVPQDSFSLALLAEQLTPSMLLNLAHLAGYLDRDHSLLSIVMSVQESSKFNTTPQVDIGQCIAYQRLCTSQLQLAATKTLHTILYDESMVNLLTYKPPSLQTVILGDYVDKSELSVTVKDVLKCLATKAVRPSPLTPALNMHEMEKLLTMLSNESLTAIAEDIAARGKEKPEEPMETEAIVLPPPTPPPPPPLPSLNASARRQDLLQRRNLGVTVRRTLSESSNSSNESQPASGPSPPDMATVNQLMDIGFSRPQVDVAMRRCEIPANTGAEARMQLLVSWIIDNPNAVAEEEERVEETPDTSRAEEERLRAQQQQEQQEADQNAAANEFLANIMIEPESPPTVEVHQKSSQHAPDLLDGPDIDEEVPDISASGLDSSPKSLKSLLLALGLSQKNQTPKIIKFSGDDPLGTNLYTEPKDSTDSDDSDSKINEESSYLTISDACTNVIGQVSKLKTLEEHLLALERVTAATQTLVARRVTMLVIASLSTQGSVSLVSNLEAVKLDGIQSLVRLLRLVDAGRVDRSTGKSFSISTSSSLLPIKAVDCLSSVITTAVGQSLGSGKQLLQSCSRDLLAAAVGGAELLQHSGSRRQRHRKHDVSRNSDISVLINPNFSVTRNLVQTLAESTGQVSMSANSAGMLQIIDALAACLFSSKLKPEHRFWALQQILKVFSTSGKDSSSLPPKKVQMTSASKLEELSCHTGQVMNCVMTATSDKKIVSIGEDNNVVLWVEDSVSSEIKPTIHSFPAGSSTEISGDESTQPGAHTGLMLPVLTQAFSGTCVAGALDNRVCVWRTSDAKNTTHTFSDLVTSLQWKCSQKGSEPPVLLVGLLNGELSLLETLRDFGSSSSNPELHKHTIDRKLGASVCSVCWSNGSGAFAVASADSTVQVFTGAGNDYKLSTEIKSLAVQSLSWMPDDSALATLSKDGCLSLWDISGDAPVVKHSFDSYKTSCIAWYPMVGPTGLNLLVTGCDDGTVHLFTVPGKPPADSDQSDSSAGISHVTCLSGHMGPVSSLVINEEACILASGDKAGSVLVWDMHTLRLLKSASHPHSTEGVVSMAWTNQGLAICYLNSNSLHLLPPSPANYVGERCIVSCLPTLQAQGITDLDKTPCLMALLKNLHLVLQDQHSYEENEMTGSQLVHTEYLQLLTSLTVGLGLHNVLLSPPHPPHLKQLPHAKEWSWLASFTTAIKMADSLVKRTSLPADSGFDLPAGVDPLPETEKHQTTDNSVWSMSMDSEIMDWLSSRPEDWWGGGLSSVYTWGKGSWNQLGHTTEERGMPNVVAQWKDVHEIVAGSYCTYAIKFDGSVSSCGDGSYGRLGHGGSENETEMRIITALQGIPVVQLVAGPRVLSSSDEGFALALTDNGDVYSWGKSYKGRLGHQSNDNLRQPKLIDAFAGLDIVMLSSCDYHCAALTSDGALYTFGSKENGKLGRGTLSSLPTSNNVGKVETYLDSDETTALENVKIGYVSCGQCFTLALSEDGTQVFGFGKADSCAFGSTSITRDHPKPLLLAHLRPDGPYVKIVSGNRSSALLNADGKVVFFGNVVDSSGRNVAATIMDFPNDEKIVDIATASQHVTAISENGNVYYWGKNTFGTGSSTAHNSPYLLSALSGKGLKQVSCGIRHCAASDTDRPTRGSSNIKPPTAVPVQYSSLKDVSIQAIYCRMLLLSHFSKVVIASWKLFYLKAKPDMSSYGINPLSDAVTRSLLATAQVEGMVSAVVSKTMNGKQHGPAVNVNRLADSESKTRMVLPQLAAQVLSKDPGDLRCNARAWKVNLAGEGADDAGGVFDETITQVCEEMEKGSVKLLIPTPNSRNKCGFNTDRFVFDPTCTSPKDIQHLKFVGVLFGVAMRTKKPLDLHLAQPMWKLLAGMTLTPEDLEEIDMIFIQSMAGIKDIHKSGMKEDDFAEMIPIESFEAQSMNGKFVPIVPGGGNIKLTYQNRKEYVEKAFNFRLHELDKQVAAVREGMSCIVPVPLLSMFTASMLERAVCGAEEVDIQMLKKVVRYRDAASQSSQVVNWLWETLEAFTNKEKILFLRFVSGRSRLPLRVSEITQRFQVSVQRQVSDNLPTSQTCFFQLRLPTYPSQEILAERLRYAITHCRSIDMDTYMLRDGGDYSGYSSPDYSDDDYYS